MADSISNWLKRNAPANKTWIHWLEGDDPPADAPEDVPYLWFVDALVRMGDPSPAKEGLVRRLAEQLSLTPAVVFGAKTPYRRPAQAMHNLLWLCAELVSPPLLFQPLWKWRQAVDAGRGAWLEQWRAGWKGSLDAPLNRALIVNQGGTELKSYWFKHLKIKASPKLTSLDRYVTALSGVAAMPEQEGGASLPEEVARSFGLFAVRLQEAIPKEDLRARIFQQQISEVSHMRPEWKDTANDLLPESIRQGWPEWAISRLRFFAYRGSGDPDLPIKAWVWEPLAKCIPPDLFPHEKIAVQCRANLIVTLKVDHKTFEMLRLVYPMFEDCRLDNPFPGPGSTLAGILDALSSLSLKHPDRVDDFMAIRRRAEQSLKTESTLSQASRNLKPKELLESRIFRAYVRALGKCSPEKQRHYNHCAQTLDKGRLDESERVEDKKPVFRAWERFGSDDYAVANKDN